VFFFFAIDSDAQFAGVARMAAPFQDSAAQDSPMATCAVQWLRACALPFTKTAFVSSVVPEVGRLLPVAMAIEGAELPPSVGHTLMTMVFLEPDIPIPVDDVDVQLQPHPLGPSAAVVAAFERTPVPPPEVGPMPPPVPGGQNVAPHAVPVRGPGYIISAPSAEICAEMYGRGLFGAPEASFNALNQVAEPGCIFLMYTPFDAKVHGVFEAISGVERVRCWGARWSGADDAGNRTGSQTRLPGPTCPSTCASGFCCRATPRPSRNSRRSAASRRASCPRGSCSSW
jgi:hypothetical protein